MAAYFILTQTVTDLDRYWNEYVPGVLPFLAKYQGEVLVGDFDAKALQGSPAKGVSGVFPEGPAERAGLRSGDVIVELAGAPVENIYDYTYAIEGLAVGEPVPIVVRRGPDQITLEITPISRH